MKSNVLKLPATPDRQYEQGEFRMIPIGQILNHPINPRGEIREDDKLLELAASIKEKGILEPLLVTPYRDAFLAVAGNRRRKAAGLAGVSELPCIIREIPDEEALELMAIENMQREDLNPIQEARMFNMMMTTGRRATIADIVRRVGVSQVTVTQRLAILKLSKPVQGMFEMQLLPNGAAPILAMVEDEGRQKAFAVKAVQAQIPLHRLEAMIRDATESPKRLNKPTGPHKTKKKVLGEYESFTRSEAVHELTREGTVAYSAIADAFNDVCDGVCYEDQGGREMCEAGRRLSAPVQSAQQRQGRRPEAPVQSAQQRQGRRPEAPVLRAQQRQGRRLSAPVLRAQQRQGRRLSAPVLRAQQRQGRRPEAPGRLIAPMIPMNRDSTTGRIVSEGGCRAARLEDLPAEGHCVLGNHTKPRSEMVVYRSKRDGYVMRPRCKECHNAGERGHRREYKRNYLRAWRRRNKSLDRSYWNNPTQRRKSTLRARGYRERDGEAITIQRRLREQLNERVTLAEARELLLKFGPGYPTRYGLTEEGLRECERIRSRLRSAARRNRHRVRVRNIEIRVLVYQDAVDSGRAVDSVRGPALMIEPGLQKSRYSGASLKRWWQERKRERRLAKAA